MSEAAERLRLLYDVSRQLSTFTDLDELLRFATRRAREIFEAEGCALLLLDRERNEFFFPVASQAEASGQSAERLSEIRFPADRGVAGWVLTNDRATIVEDTSKDERFYDGVDRGTAMQTHSLLCAPLRTHSGNIGVVEVVNPGPGCRTKDDLEFLEALAGDVAAAHENAALFAGMRAELIGLRQVCRVGGLCLLVLGALVGAGAVFAHFARALPVTELVGRPGAWAALALLTVGSILVLATRGSGDTGSVRS